MWRLPPNASAIELLRRLRIIDHHWRPVVGRHAMVIGGILRWRVVLDRHVVGARSKHSGHRNRYEDTKHQFSPFQINFTPLQPERLSIWPLSPVIFSRTPLS
jgi:hypothetical protein